MSYARLLDLFVVSIFFDSLLQCNQCNYPDIFNALHCLCAEECVAESTTLILHAAVWPGGQYLQTVLTVLSLLKELSSQPYTLREHLQPV